MFNAKCLANYLSTFYSPPGASLATPVRGDTTLEAIAGLLVPLLAYQLGADIQGHIAEIGVGHGRSLIPLACATRKPETVVAVDCFAAPTLTPVAVQGRRIPRGDTEDNVRQFLGNAIPNITWRPCDVAAPEIPQHEEAFFINLGRLRLVHLDVQVSRQQLGGMLAAMANSLAPSGIVIVGGYGDARYPFVKTVCSEFLMQRPHFRRVAAYAGKVILSRERDMRAYQNLLSNCDVTEI